MNTADPRQAPWSVSPATRPPDFSSYVLPVTKTSIAKWRNNSTSGKYSPILKYSMNQSLPTVPSVWTTVTPTWRATPRGRPVYSKETSTPSWPQISRTSLHSRQTKKALSGLKILSSHMIQSVYCLPKRFWTSNNRMTSPMPSPRTSRLQLE